MTDALRTLGSVGDVLRSAGLLTEVRGPEDVAVQGVTQDSRRVRVGDLFLAWRGTDHDGHLFVDQARALGAVAAVVERPVEVEIPQLVVRDGRLAAALVAAGVLGHPERALRSVAVTGTNGKTTTALLLRDLLSDRYRTAALGTLGVVDDGGVRPGSEALTTPGPVELATWLRRLVDEGFEAVVLEASSHALAQRRLDAIGFDVAVFTNLTQDHLDYHGSVDAYRAAKLRLAEMVSREGHLVVKANEPAWEGLRTSDGRVRTFAIDEGHDSEPIADVRAIDLVEGPGGSSFRLDMSGAVREVRFPLIGRYNVENALAAAAAARVLGCDADGIAARLSVATQVPGRLEVVRREPFMVLIDFAHTPAALEGMLGALRPLARRRLIVLFGAGGDRDRGKRRAMAEAVKRYADLVILTSDNPRTENPERILDDLAVGLSGRPFERLTDRRLAIRRALQLAEPGDTVVLAGKGHETYQVVGAERVPFDERAVVARALEESTGQ